MNKVYNPCLNVSDINLTLKKTFEFIKAHQYSNGQLTTTEVIMSINLIANQISGTTTPKQVVTDNVSGEIYEIHETYVVMLAKNSDSPTPSLYYISYEKIIYLDSFVITHPFDEYVDYMNLLPPLCDDPCNPELILIDEINTAIAQNLGSNKSLQYIYHGIRSDNHKLTDYLFVKNLLTVEQFYLTPITVINGYALIPNC